MVAGIREYDETHYPHDKTYQLSCNEYEICVDRPEPSSEDEGAVAHCVSTDNFRQIAAEKITHIEASLDTTEIVASGSGAAGGANRRQKGLEIVLTKPDHKSTMYAKKMRVLAQTFDEMYGTRSGGRSRMDAWNVKHARNWGRIRCRRGQGNCMLMSCSAQWIYWRVDSCIYLAFEGDHEKLSVLPTTRVQSHSHIIIKPPGNRTPPRTISGQIWEKLMVRDLRKACPAERKPNPIICAWVSDVSFR